jgi:hypothetical protein
MLEGLFQPTHLIVFVVVLVPLFLMGRILCHLGSKLKK